jgi:3-oxoisoapionate kinase
LVAGAPRFAEPGPVDRLAVVSGSCSATTERQIRYAESQGFEAFAVDPRGLARGDETLVNQAVRQGLDSLARGRSVVLYTALGPTSDVGAQFENENARHAIGRALGDIQGALIKQAGLRRAIIAGGDTSSHALRQLGVYALTTRLPLPTTPGSPLCLAHSDEPAFDGLEIALKGGQIGRDDYFHRIRLGSA